LGTSIGHSDGVVHCAARVAGHAAERNILERRAEAATGMSLYMREVDHEG
jgi:hypothetical protein